MSKKKKQRSTDNLSPQGTQVTQASDETPPLVTEVCSMDDIFPGFLQWQKEREARATLAPRVHPLERGLFEAWKQAVAQDEPKKLPRAMPGKEGKDV